MELEYKKDNLTSQPYEYYLAQYQAQEPFAMGSRIGIPYCEEEHAFFVRFLNVMYKVTFPKLEVSHQETGNGIYVLENDIHAKILLLHYMTEGDGLSCTGRSLSYHDLPWGEVYYRQFKGRCIDRLARTYGNRTSVFSDIMERMHGLKQKGGDVSYQIELMTGLHLSFILWEGDEEFQPSAQILFSDNFPAAFAAEDVAYIGDIILNCMKKVEALAA